MLETLDGPPAYGSLRESVLLYYVLYRDRIEHYRLRALTQALLDKEQSAKVFEEYMQQAYPWMGTATARERQEHIKLLNDWVKQGPLKVSALPTFSEVKSRLKPAPAPLKQAQDVNKIYRQMDSVRRGPA